MLKHKLREPVFWMQLVAASCVVVFMFKAWGVIETNSNLHTLAFVLITIVSAAAFSCVSEFAIILGGCRLIGTFVVVSTLTGMGILPFTPKVIAMFTAVGAVMVTCVVEVFVRSASKQIS